jgi:DNA-binding MarR family transcriptional regulator
VTNTNLEHLELPLTPYAGTSGWSGSRASYDRVVDEDTDGTTSKRQKETLGHLYNADHMGLTWKELADITGWHHGQASGVLSVLHKENLIIRLHERRNRSSIYVLDQFVKGRELSNRTVRRCKNCGCKL